MTGNGIVCAVIFYFLTVAFGVEVAVGAVSMLIVGKMAVSV